MSKGGAGLFIATLLFFVFSNITLADDIQIRKIQPLFANYYKRGLYLPVKVEVFSRGGFSGKLTLTADTKIRFSKEIAISQNSSREFIIPVIIFSEKSVIHATAFTKGKQVAKKVFAGYLEDASLKEPLCVKLNEFKMVENPLFFEAVDEFVVDKKRPLINFFLANGYTLLDNKLVRVRKIQPSIDPDIFLLVRKPRWLQIEITHITIFVILFLFMVFALVFCLLRGLIKKSLFYILLLAGISIFALLGFILIKRTEFHAQRLTFCLHGGSPYRYYFLTSLDKKTSTLKFDEPVRPLFASICQMLNSDFEIAWGEDFSCEFRKTKFKAGTTLIFFSIPVALSFPSEILIKEFYETIEVSNNSDFDMHEICYIEGNFFKDAGNLAPGQTIMINTAELNIDPPTPYARFISRRFDFEKCLVYCKKSMLSGMAYHDKEAIIFQIRDYFIHGM